MGRTRERQPRDRARGMGLNEQQSLAAHLPRGSSGDRVTPSFAELFTLHAAYVIGLLGRLGVATADVEDVAQEVFIVIHARLDGFEARSSLKTWICGICVRKASEYRRKAYRRRERPSINPEWYTDVRPSDTQPDDAEAMLMRRQQVEHLQRALGQLDDVRLEVFVLYEIEELPMTDVARAIGCPLFTAYTRLRSARKLMQTLFKRASAQPSADAIRRTRQGTCGAE